MAYTTLDEVNTSAGIHTLFTYAADTVPILMPLFLFGLFVVVLLGSYFASVRVGGRGDFPASFAAAGFITSIFAVLMSIIPLINLPTLSITLGIAIAGAIWLYFSR